MSRNEDNFSAQIPAGDVSTEGIEYYITATDGLNTATHPVDYSNPHQITVSETEDDEDDDGGFLAGFEVMMVILSVVVAAGVVPGRARGKQKI